MSNVGTIALITVMLIAVGAISYAASRWQRRNGGPAEPQGGVAVVAGLAAMVAVIAALAIGWR